MAGFDYSALPKKILNKIDIFSFLISFQILLWVLRIVSIIRWKWYIVHIPLFFLVAIIFLWKTGKQNRNKE